MKSGETCHKLKVSHVIHAEKLNTKERSPNLKSKGSTEHPVELPQPFETVRVCTRAKSYKSSDNKAKGKII